MRASERERVSESESEDMHAPRENACMHARRCIAFGGRCRLARAAARVAAMRALPCSRAAGPALAIVLWLSTHSSHGAHAVTRWVGASGTAGLPLSQAAKESVLGAGTVAGGGFWASPPPSEGVSRPLTCVALPSEALSTSDTAVWFWADTPVAVASWLRL